MVGVAIEYVHSVVCFLRYWVVTAASPRIASQNAFNGKPRAFQWSVLSDCLYCIFAACGREPAAWRKEWRNAVPIEFNGQYEQCGKNFFHLIKRLAVE